MKKLTDREQNIVLATIRIWNVNAKSGFVPNCELVEPSFNLPADAMRDIRDLVQEVRPRALTPKEGATTIWEKKWVLPFSDLLLRHLNKTE